MKATVAVVAAFVGFWGFVLWVADAFAPWELAAVLGVVLVASFFGWVICRAAGLADRRQDELAAARRRRDWDWPVEDSSSVRHGGLGR